ncbi:MAG: hypothetical protein OXU20_24765 [Myxococcales bacterium]|nr:hypothetical protein [Myxococcales bacterium]
MKMRASLLLTYSLILLSACAADESANEEQSLQSPDPTAPTGNAMAPTMATAEAMPTMSAGAMPSAGSLPASTTGPAPMTGTDAQQPSAPDGPQSPGAASASEGATAGMGGTEPAGMAEDPMNGMDPQSPSGPGEETASGMDTAAPDPASTAGKLPRVDSTDGPGPFDGVVKVKDTPPGGWLIYPEDIGRDGIKHPLFIFGPGGGTTPQTYDMRGMHWDRYGSYGFVIYVLPRSTGDGSAMKRGLDWLIEQNDDSSSPLHQHLDTSKVCASGHSMGSVTTFDFMPDDRVTTTIHISGGSFDGQGPSNLSKPTMFLCGPSSGADVAYPQCEGDFRVSEVPTFYTKIQGSDHLTSGRLGWPAITAWMLWHLAGHEEWKAEFLEPGGQFQMGIYDSQLKNW